MAWDTGRWGEAFRFLLRYREATARPVGRKAYPDEREVASVLSAMDRDEYEAFDRFLAGQGLALASYDEAMPGVTGTLWLLARRGDAVPEALFSADVLFRRLRLTRQETQEAVATWFVHLYLTLLYLLYNRYARAVSEVSRYRDAEVTLDELDDAAATHIEQIRQVGPEGGIGEKVADILCAANPQARRRRAARFLELMVEGGLLTPPGEHGHRQTLLGATEIAQSFTHSLAHVVPPDADLDSIVNVLDPESARRDEAPAAQS